MLAAFPSCEDAKLHAANRRDEKDIGTALSQVRGIAQRLGTPYDFTRQLCSTADPQSRLVAILISDPLRYTAEQLDTMLRDTRVPTLQD